MLTGRASAGNTDRRGSDVYGVFIDALAPEDAAGRIRGWARSREPRTVVFCNVHSVVTSAADAHLAQAVEQANLCVPDGAPIAWTLRRFGFEGQRRVSGPDLTARLCQMASDEGIPVYFYGSAPQTLQRLRAALSRRWPALRVAGMHSPPFRPMTEPEQHEDVERINTSGAMLVFVGLGCPKQEIWMNRHAGRVRAVTLGVGAAFDFLAGTVPRAPAWMRDHGLEWLHRLLSEPRRLWRRYLVTNALFLKWVLGTLLRNGGRFSPTSRAGQ